MPRSTDGFARLARRMRQPALPAPTIEETPSIADLLRRIELQIARRDAA